MSLPLPNLDDRTYADLVKEMRALIPRYAPNWTNHNVSDPGITLLELLAWLTEALIYRLNRIPEASRSRLLELLGAVLPAQPATANLNVTAVGLKENLLLPGATPLTANPGYKDITLPFETVCDLLLTPDQPGSTVQVQQTELVPEEQLGRSNGQAHQVFYLAKSFLAGDSRGCPMLSWLTVGGQQWAYKPGFLGLNVADFSIEPRSGRICFGDDVIGRVPPAGAEIVVSYRATLGQQGNVPAHTNFGLNTHSPGFPYPVRQALDSGVSFYFECQTEAVGGTDPAGLAEARDQLNRDFKTRWRVITQQDFEKVVLEQAQFKLVRAKCLPERDLTAPDPDAPRPGHVSLIIVPAASADKPQPSVECLEQVRQFLDGRRLMTCRPHVAGPVYTEVRIEAEVVHRAKTDKKKLLEMIEANLREFFNHRPGPKKPGWPFGRAVYASEVYQVIEGTDEVDHVIALTLWSRKGIEDWGQPKNGHKIDIAPYGLVHFVFQPGDIVLRLPVKA